MTIYLKDEATSKAVRKLARLRGTTLTEAVRSAVADALAKQNESKRSTKVLDALRKLQVEIAKYPRTGLKADKAFFDELSGNI
jgi:antitoxin VapB